VLEVTGAAAHAWSRRARQIAPAIPGVRQFRADRLVDVTRRELMALTEEIAGYALHFVWDTAHFAPSQEVVLQRLPVALQRHFDAALQVGADVHVEVIGHTDSTGSEGHNLQLSRHRAEHVLATFRLHDLPRSFFTTAGVGSRGALHAETTEELRALNRRVTFRITLREPPKR
jgi:OOP family OmpA-OmpF porin